MRLLTIWKFNEIIRRKQLFPFSASYRHASNANKQQEIDHSEFAYVWPVEKIRNIGFFSLTNKNPYLNNFTQEFLHILIPEKQQLPSGYSIMQEKLIQCMK